MLLSKPEGMCTVSSDLTRKTVTIGFLEPEFAKRFNNHLIDKVIEATMCEPIVVSHNVDLIDPILLAKWRSAFQAHFKHLDFALTKDAWDRDAYLHEAVQSLWDGWLAHAMYTLHIQQLASVPIPRSKSEGVITACPSSM